MRDVAQAGGIAMMGSSLLEGPLELKLTFYQPRRASHFGSGRNSAKLKPSAPIYPDKRPDLTKLIRAVEDALTGIVWRDDAQVVMQRAAKLYGEPARVVVSVVRL